jgi:hypothetical protein
MRRAALFALTLAPAPAAASSGDAWEEFRTMVRDTCLAQIEMGGTIEIEVNPFGSQTYGAAIVTVTSDGEGVQRMICIVDKATGAAELTVPY